MRYLHFMIDQWNYLLTYMRPMSQLRAGQSTYLSSVYRISKKEPFCHLFELSNSRTKYNQYNFICTVTQLFFLFPRIFIPSCFVFEINVIHLHLFHRVYRKLWFYILYIISRDGYYRSNHHVYFRGWDWNSLRTEEAFRTGDENKKKFNMMQTIWAITEYGKIASRYITHWQISSTKPASRQARTMKKKEIQKYETWTESLCARLFFFTKSRAHGS